MKAIYLCVLLLSACATGPAKQYQWAHASGASRAQFDQDFAQCEAQALATHPLTPQEQALALFGACMRGKGWRLVER